jgi:hypothetical protein
MENTTRATLATLTALTAGCADCCSHSHYTYIHSFEWINPWITTICFDYHATTDTDRFDLIDWPHSFTPSLLHSLAPSLTHSLSINVNASQDNIRAIVTVVPHILKTRCVSTWDTKTAYYRRLHGQVRQTDIHTWCGDWGCYSPPRHCTALVPLYFIYFTICLLHKK